MSLIGKRVEIAPHFARWMEGDRYATVLEAQGSSGMALLYKVRFEVSGVVRTFADSHLKVVSEG